MSLFFFVPKVLDCMMFVVYTYRRGEERRGEDTNRKEMKCAMVATQ